MTYNAHLINPVKRIITEVIIDGDYKQLYELLHCQIFTAVQINEKRDTIYVDDEGLFVENQVFFLHKDYPYQPLAGYGLVVGTDDEGESITPSVSLQETREKVTFLSRAGLLKWMSEHPEA